VGCGLGVEAKGGNVLLESASLQPLLLPLPDCLVVGRRLPDALAKAPWFVHCEACGGYLKTLQEFEPKG
jgi:hypothetical protein